MNLQKILLPTFLFIACSFQSFSQEKKEKTFYEKLTRFTFGVAHTNYEKAKFIKENPENNSNFEIEPTTSYFLDYRFLQYKNHSLKAGVQLGKFANSVTYNGNVVDTKDGQIRNVNSFNVPPRFKTKTIEVSLNYNYLIELSKKFNLELSAGIAYEKNDTYELYIIQTNFGDLQPDGGIVPYQLTYESIYIMQNDFFRRQVGATVGYTTEYGLISLGVKYSVMSENFIEGQYEFYNAPADEGQSYGFFDVSGKYLNFSVSFTPSKNLFKKKK